MRETTRSHAYSFRKAIFTPASLRWSLSRFPGHSQTGQSGARRIEGRLKWLQPFLGFGERTARVCRLSSFLCMFQWEACRERTAELKSPQRRGQHLRQWNQRMHQSERFYKTSSESLKVAFTLRSFLRKKKARIVILWFSVQNAQGKKSVRRRHLNQASPVVVFYTWRCIAGHDLTSPRDRKKSGSAVCPCWCLKASPWLL